jgi:hypothetical protein
LHHGQRVFGEKRTVSSSPGMPLPK